MKLCYTYIKFSFIRIIGYIVKEKYQSEIQNQYCSSYDKRKICSYDIEYIDSETKPLIHQSSRFWYFLGGEASIIINGNEYLIKPNSFVAILPWDTTIIKNVVKPLHFIKIIYNDEIITNVRYNYNVSQKFIKIIDPIIKNPVVYLSDDEAKKIISIMDTIKSEVGTESLYDIPEERMLSDIYVSNKLIELLINFDRYSTKLPLELMNGNPVEIDDRSSVFKYIYSHVSTNISLGILSDIFYMSESSISKYIKEVTGLTFSELVNEIRISKTIDLLTFTDMSISDIAEIVGFSDASHLIKIFTPRINLSPNQYRDIYKAKEHIFREKDKSITFELIQYINDHYMENINITDVMKKFNISFTDVNITLMYMVEKNFDELLHYLRINKACELLLSSEDTIIDIAIQVGYNNVKTFNRNFTRLKNITPNDFRKNVNLQFGSESKMVEEDD